MLQDVTMKFYEPPSTDRALLLEDVTMKFDEPPSNRQSSPEMQSSYATMCIALL